MWNQLFQVTSIEQVMMFLLLLMIIERIINDVI